MSALEAWLAARGLAPLNALLVKHGVDFDTLGELTEGDLREIGLSLGERKRLLRALHLRRSSGTTTNTPQAVPSEQKQQ